MTSAPPAVTPDPSCFGACTGCGRRGVPYEHRGLLFGGLCACRGDRLCPACRDARMAGTGVNVLAVEDRISIPPYVLNSVRDADVALIGQAYECRGIAVRSVRKKRGEAPSPVAKKDRP